MNTRAVLLIPAFVAVVAIGLILLAMLQPAGAAGPQGVRATSGVLYRAAWNWAYPKPLGANLTRIKCVSDLECWAAGDSGTIVHTGDGGATWDIQHEGVVPIPSAYGTLSGSDIRAIDFVGRLHGWVALNWIMLHTEDGGQTWVTMTVPAISGYGLTDVDFVDQNNGWVTADGNIIHTTDGGRTWSRYQAPFPNPPFFWGVSALDANTAFVVSKYGSVWRSNDGGSVWITVTTSLGYDMRRIRFFDANHGWVAGLAYASGAGCQPVAYRTDNGGLTWARSPFTSTVACGSVIDMSFTDFNTGWIATWAGEIYHTTDGGATWTTQVPPLADAKFSGVHFLDATHGWAVGNLGAIVHTADGGMTWSVRPPGPLRSSIAVNAFYDVAVLDPNRYMAVGTTVRYRGVILTTEDGGATWSGQVPDPAIRSLNGITFASRSTGWAVGGGGVLKTTDGGATWTRVYSNAVDYLQGVSFVDELNGWVSGFRSQTVGGVYSSVAVLLHTSDGGVTWREQDPGAFKALTKVKFVDASFGWALAYTTWSSRNSGGYYGHILSTTDGGQSWSVMLSRHDGRLQNLTFVDRRHGWVVGDRGTPLHTKDGGLTWLSQARYSDEPYYYTSLYGVDFLSSTYGWVVGWAGSLTPRLITGNAGGNWSNEPQPGFYGLYAVRAYDPGHVVAVGSNGAVFTRSLTAVGTLPDRAFFPLIAGEYLAGGW